MSLLGNVKLVLGRKIEPAEEDRHARTWTTAICGRAVQFRPAPLRWSF
jgi:hypothetical protein